VNSDPWQDAGILLRFKVKAGQHGMASQVIATPKSKTQLSAGKDHGKCFGIQKEWVMFIFFHRMSQLMYKYYNNWLHSDVHKAVQKIKPGKLSKKIILLHDNTCLHLADWTMTLATVGWEIMNHPPFSSDIAPSDIICLDHWRHTKEDRNFNLWWTQTWCIELAMQSGWNF
jgi:hypothetical protein